MRWWKEAIAAVRANDPAARSTLSILFTYPGVRALAWHRLAHWLWKHKLYFFAEYIAYRVRRGLSIEIHPAAKIASGVFIDHGSGLVIGETAIIETGVLLYHGATLGGTGKDRGKRHPTVREGALVSAHAQLIGPIEIGKNAKIGASAVVIKDVPEGATVVGIPGKVVRIYGKKLNEL